MVTTFREADVCLMPLHVSYQSRGFHCDMSSAYFYNQEEHAEPMDQERGLLTLRVVLLYNALIKTGLVKT